MDPYILSPVWRSEYADDVPEFVSIRLDRQICERILLGRNVYQMAAASMHGFMQLQAEWDLFQFHWGGEVEEWFAEATEGLSVEYADLEDEAHILAVPRPPEAVWRDGIVPDDTTMHWSKRYVWFSCYIGEEKAESREIPYRVFLDALNEEVTGVRKL